MARPTIAPSRLGAEVAGILEDYRDDVLRAVNAESRQAAERLVRATKAAAPRGHTRRKHYASSIACRRLRSTPVGDVYVWYVRAPEHRLSHLLERDHATGGPSNRGRARGTGFISRAFAEESETYARRVREVVGRVA